MISQTEFTKNRLSIFKRIMTDRSEKFKKLINEYDQMSERFERLKALLIECEKTIDDLTQIRREACMVLDETQPEYWELYIAALKPDDADYARKLQTATLFMKLSRS
jgi:chromosome segregation ATPase